MPVAWDTFYGHIPNWRAPKVIAARVLVCSPEHENTSCQDMYAYLLIIGTFMTPSKSHLTSIKFTFRTVNKTFSTGASCIWFGEKMKGRNTSSSWMSIHVQDSRMFDHMPDNDKLRSYLYLTFHIQENIPPADRRIVQEVIPECHSVWRIMVLSENDLFATGKQWLSNHLREITMTYPT